MAATVIGFVDAHGIVHRLEDGVVSSTTRYPGQTVTEIRYADGTVVNTPIAEAVVDDALADQAAAPSGAVRTEVVEVALVEVESEEVPHDPDPTTRVILADTTAAFSIQLPDPATFEGVLTVKDIGDASAENITLLQFDSEEINGAAASYVMDQAGQVIHLVTDHTDWFLI